MVPAAEAVTLGLFDRVVPHAELLPAARQLAQCWAAQPAGAVRWAKAALYASEQRSLVAMLDLEVTQLHELLATPEVRERIGAAQARRRL
jgi:enoyl-CoA hydratase/carnithine racemase